MAFKSRHNLDKLLHRRQFVLGPNFLTSLSSWNRITISDRICLMSHPDLHTHKVDNGTTSLVVLGDILDPNHPDHTNTDVLNRLIGELQTCKNIDDFIPVLSCFGGRWILIAVKGSSASLIHDATGTRQVYYTNVNNRDNFELWCASQPGLLVSRFGFDIDPVVMNLMGSPDYKTQPTYWWPGDRSPYKEIRRLLPNHYLDLSTGSPKRYWPISGVNRLSFEHAIFRISRILKGTMLAAGNRFDLALPITAGYDSRIALAASRDLRDRIFCYTLVKGSMRKSHPDVTVSSRMLSKIGLKHYIIKCPTSMDPFFKHIYNRNVTNAHDHWGAMAQSMYEKLPEDSVCVKSTVSEIAKCFYKKHICFRERKVNSDDLARVTQLGTSRFVIEAFEHWLSLLKNSYDYDLLDLFYWEQRLGCWAATNYTEWDLVQDVFSPFNCRDLITDMLAIDEEHRKPPERRLHKALIEHMWSDLLLFPVNPPPRQKLTLRVKRKTLTTVKVILKRTGLLPLTKRVVATLQRYFVYPCRSVLKHFVSYARNWVGS